MSVLRLLAGTAILAGAVFSAGPSQASVIDFSGPMTNMGTVASGQTGTISNNFMGTTSGPYLFGTGSDYGFLPSDSEITFTYTFSNLTAAVMNGYDSYQYTTGPSTFSGSSAASSGSPTTSVGYTNMAVSAPLVLAAANVSSDLTQGTASFVNNSAGVSQFQTTFAGLFSNGGHLVSVNYAVSSVPLPAALPLFATVLVGMAGFAFMRRRQQI